MTPSVMTRVRCRVGAAAQVAVPAAAPVQVQPVDALEGQRGVLRQDLGPIRSDCLLLRCLRVPGGRGSWSHPRRGGGSTSHRETVPPRWSTSRIVSAAGFSSTASSSTRGSSPAAPSDESRGAGACVGGWSAGVDVLPHVPGDGHHGVSVERWDARARATDCRPRVSEDDEAVRPDGGQRSRSTRSNAS